MRGAGGRGGGGADCGCGAVRGVAAAATPAAPSGTTAAWRSSGAGASATSAAAFWRWYRAETCSSTEAIGTPSAISFLRSANLSAAPARRRSKMREGGRAGRGGGVGAATGVITGGGAVGSIFIRRLTSRHKPWKPYPRFLIRLLSSNPPSNSLLNHSKRLSRAIRSPDRSDAVNVDQ